MFMPDDTACATGVESVSVQDHQRPPNVLATERALARAIVLPGSSGGGGISTQPRTSIFALRSSVEAGI